MKKLKILNTNQLKYIALIFMALDSVFFIFPNMPSWVHLITRFVAPLFAYLTTQGFFLTRNRKKHLLRLWIAAILMQLGNLISLLLLGKNYQILDNIFLTLAVGYSAIYFWQKAREEQIGKVKNAIIGTLIFILGLVGIPLGQEHFFLEGGVPVLMLMLIFWAFHGNPKKAFLVFGLWSVLSFVIMGPDLNIGHFHSLGDWFDMFCYNSDMMSFLFLPFLLFYNGQKGSSKPIYKWFFYIFYPAHFWLLHLLAFFLQVK